MALPKSWTFRAVTAFFRVRFSHPNGNRPLITVNAFVVLFRHRAEGAEHKGAELLRRCLGQSPRLIHAPMLDREVRYGENLAGLLLDLPRQAVSRDGDRYPRLVTGNPAPA